MKTRRKKTVILGIVLTLFLIQSEIVTAQESTITNPSKLAEIFRNAVLKNVVSVEKTSTERVNSPSPERIDNFLKMGKTVSLKSSAQNEVNPGIQLTFSGYNKLYTDWSSDGDWITYAESGDDGLFDIWIVPTAGGKPVNLTGNLAGDFLFPSFYADNRTVVFTNNNTSTIESIDIITLQHDVLLFNAVRGFWSNTGRYFIYRIADTAELAIVDTELSDSWILADGDNSYGVSCFTPDEKFIITSVLTESGEKLFRTSIEGGGLEQLTDNEGRHWFPNVSQDGIWVIYAYYDMDYIDSKIMVYNMETGKSQIVFPDMAAIQSSPSFSPNGLKFSYLLGLDVSYEVFTKVFPFAVPPAPELDITAPDGGETLIAGEYFDIMWDVDGIGKVKLEYSIDGGSSWNLIADNVAAADGWFGWEAVPDVASDNCFLRITGAALDGSGIVEDWSDGTFSISGAPYLRVIAPNGGEKWEIGKSYDIKWEVRNVEKIRIAYSTDDGSNWTRIIRDVDAAPGKFTWTIPNDLTPSETCRMRIVDESNDEVFSESYTVFTIATTDTTPYLRVISPNGGEELEILKNFEITWEARNVSTVSISYATDGGVHWKQIASNIDASVGTYIWRAPDDPSTACRIRIQDESSDLTVLSYTNFKILRAFNEPWVRVISPNGGEELKGGAVRNILWEPSGELTIQIRLSTDGGETWKVIADDITNNAGAYSWTVPYNTASTNCLIWVGDPDYAKRYDTNDVPFTILVTPQEESVEVLTPNGGEEWVSGGTYEIKWSSTGVSNVAIYYSLDDRVNWFSISEGTPASTGAIQWITPKDTEAHYCYIWIGDIENDQIQDESDARFSIVPSVVGRSVHVLSPNGGEELQTAGTYEIRWSALGIRTVTIWYSIDDGINWIPIIENFDATNGAYLWVVPTDLVTSKCHISIGDSNDNAVYDVSDNYFTIVSGGTSGLQAFDYFALQTGATWSGTGVETDVDGNVLDSYDYTTTISGTTEINGKTYWILSSDSTDYIRIDNNIVWVYTGDISSPKVMSLAKTARAAKAEKIAKIARAVQEDEWPFYNFNVPQGGVWDIYTWADSGEDWSSFSKYTGKLIGVESVTVPAGSYSNCAVFQMNFISTYTSSGSTSSDAETSTWRSVSTDTVWLAPGIGPVQYTEHYKDFENGVLVDESFTTEKMSSFAVEGGVALTLLTPAGGEQFAAGSEITIKWASTDISYIDIGYSIDGGSTDTMLAENFDATKGSFVWQIPKEIESSNCYVWINDSNNQSVEDSNSEPFTIYTAATNEKAVFSLDTDLKTVGFQGNVPVGNINAGDTVGFVIYAGEWLTSSTAVITMNWDGAYAGFLDMFDNLDGSQIYINGEDMTLPSEKNVFVRAGSPSLVNIVDSSEGSVKIAFTGSSVSSTAAPTLSSGMVIFAVFKTTDAFGSSDSLVVNVGINLSDGSGGVKNLGERRFKAFGSQEQSITLLSPTGGENWAAGSTHTIEWNAVGVEDIFISVNWNGMASGEWYYIYSGAEHIDASLGSLEWTIPGDINSTECNIWIKANDAESVEAVSGQFTIFTETQEPSLTLLSPQGGEEWAVGTTQRIEWEASNVEYIEIVILYEGVDGVLYYLTADTKSVDASIGYYNWFVTVPAGITPTDCYIFVRKTDDYSINDFNATPFSIIEGGQEATLELITPIGGEKWFIRSEQTIRWRSTGIEFVKLEYSTDGGSSWKLIKNNVPASTGVIAALGSFRWIVPDEITTQCLVRISDASNSDLNDVSGNAFSITGGNFITVTAPEEGNVWSVGAEYEIRWIFEGVNNVKLEYSTNSGSDWTVIEESVTASTASYMWTIPDKVSSQCVIRISDVSDALILGESGLFTISQPNITIQHAPITTAAENAEFTFNAQVTSDADIDQVILYYRKTGNKTFENQLELKDSGNGKYSGKIVAGIFTAPGMEYYIIARDSNNKQTRNPIDNEFHSITAQVPDIKSTFTVPGGSAQTSYRMVSVPLNITKTNIADQLTGRLPLGTQGPDWRMFRYSPGSTSPAEYPNIQGFTPGTAYWVISKQNYQLSAPQGVTVTTGESFKIELKQGWNDIANPWMFNITWNDKENPSGANLDIWSYDGKWTGPNTATAMEPWKGYAVFNYESSARIIYLKPGTTQQVDKTVAEAGEPEWFITIGAMVGEAVDTVNYLGVRSDASVEWDRYDHVEPPAVGEYVSVAFPHSDWTKYPYDYTIDFRPPEKSVSWEFIVRTNIGRENVHVELEGMETIPEESLLYVIDHKTGEPVALNGNSFNFVSGSNVTERQFTLVVTSDDDFGNGTKSLPEQFVTATCYPNPFNPQTTIRYTVSMPGLVKITVFNALGQKVRDYDFGFTQQGTHEFIFDASDLTSGLYFYKVDSGKASVTEKMLFMK